MTTHTTKHRTDSIMDTIARAFSELPTGCYKTEDICRAVYDLAAARGIKIRDRRSLGTMVRIIADRESIPFVIRDRARYYLLKGAKLASEHTRRHTLPKVGVRAHMQRLIVGVVKSLGPRETKIGTIIHEIGNQHPEILERFSDMGRHIKRAFMPGHFLSKYGHLRDQHSGTYHINGYKPELKPESKPLTHEESDASMLGVVRKTATIWVNQQGKIRFVAPSNESAKKLEAIISVFKKELSEALSA